MPRNASGIYTLPPGNPVAPDTVIETAWANPTMADIAQALTDSMTRTGTGGMLAELYLIDGSLQKPSLSFLSQSSLGLYRPADNVLGIASNGVDVARFADTGIGLNKNVGIDGTLTINGAVAANGDTTVTGAFSVTGGATMTTIIGTDITANNFLGGFYRGAVALVDGTMAAPALHFNSDPTTGIFFSTGGLTFASAGVGLLQVTPTGIFTGNLGYYAWGGTAAQPAYSFGQDRDTGFYQPAPGTLAVVVDGVEQARWGGGAAPMAVPTGTILDFGGTSTPAGYLPCNGSAISRTEYAALFAAIGTTWGAGDGSTTFNLPNLARRVLVGAGGTQVAGPAPTVGSFGGAETVTLDVGHLPSHNHGIADNPHTHGVNDPGHAHTYNDPTIPTAGSNAYQNGPQNVQWRIESIAARSTVGSTTGITIAPSGTGANVTFNTGAGNPFGNFSPAATTLKIIKT